MNMVTADGEGEGRFFTSECVRILALNSVTCLGVRLILVICFGTCSIFGDVVRLQKVSAVES